MDQDQAKLATPSTGVAPTGRQAQTTAVNDLITRIQSADDQVRGAAWQEAAKAGAAAIRPLAGLLTHAHFEVARSAKRALYKIVRHAGRPRARSEAKAVEAELVNLLRHDAVAVRREMLWLLSEIGSEKAVTSMANLLTDSVVREDARCALMRLPGREVTAAFKSAFATAPEESKAALAESLRQRGERVVGYPSRKRLPARGTTSPNR